MLDDDTVVEIKCPFNDKELEAVEALKNKKSKVAKAFNYSKEVFTMKKTDDYYYQVQCQMQCTGRQKCLFVVGTTKTIHHFYIPRDQEFIDKMMSRAKSFFDNYLAPDVVILRLRKKNLIMNPLENLITEQSGATGKARESIIQKEPETNSAEIINEEFALLDAMSYADILDEFAEEEVVTTYEEDCDDISSETSVTEDEESSVNDSDMDYE